MELHEIGTAEKPIRASMLPALMQCPMSAVMRLFGEDDGAGEAAQTGSLIHVGVNTLAKTGNTRLALATIHAALPEYPKALLEKAEKHFNAYAQDPRNAEAKVLLAEEAVRYVIDGVYISGHVDLVVEGERGPELRDIKTGSSCDGWGMLHDYFYQLAAYQVAASERLNRRVERAFVVRTQDYLRVSGGHGPVFWESPWSYEDAIAAMKLVAARVKEIRKATLYIAPNGRMCSWCPAQGVSVCLPAMKGLTNGK